MSEKLAELILFNKPRSEQASTGLESPQPYSRARSRRKFRVTLTALWSQAGTPAPAKLCSAGLKWSRLLCAVALALRFGDSGRGRNIARRLLGAAAEEEILHLSRQILTR